MEVVEKAEPVKERRKLTLKEKYAELMVIAERHEARAREARRKAQALKDSALAEAAALEKEAENL